MPQSHRPYLPLPCPSVKKLKKFNVNKGAQDNKNAICNKITYSVNQRFNMVLFAVKKTLKIIVGVAHEM
jgi:hypothetical protein